MANGTMSSDRLRRHNLIPLLIYTGLRGLVTEDLIEEHRRRPLGQHSDGLMRLLNLFCRAPAYALYSRAACREFQVIRLPVPEGSEPQPFDDIVYTDQNEALHAVFLCNLEDLMRNAGAK